MGQGSRPTHHEMQDTVESHVASCPYPLALSTCEMGAPKHRPGLGATRSPLLTCHGIKSFLRVKGSHGGLGEGIDAVECCSESIVPTQSRRAQESWSRDKGTEDDVPMGERRQVGALGGARTASEGFTLQAKASSSDHTPCCTWIRHKLGQTPKLQNRKAMVTAH